MTADSFSENEEIETAHGLRGRAAATNKKITVLNGVEELKAMRSHSLEEKEISVLWVLYQLLQTKWQRSRCIITDK